MEERGMEEEEAPTWRYLELLPSAPGSNLFTETEHDGGPAFEDERDFTVGPRPLERLYPPVGAVPRSNLGPQASEPGWSLVNVQHSRLEDEGTICDVADEKMSGREKKM